MAAIIASTPINAKKRMGRASHRKKGRRGAPMPLILERASLTFDPGPAWVEVRPSSEGSRALGPGFGRSGVRGQGPLVRPHAWGQGCAVEPTLRGGARTLPQARARAIRRA